jgi:hypothetical protein
MRLRAGRAVGVALSLVLVGSGAGAGSAVAGPAVAGSASSVVPLDGVNYQGPSAHGAYAAIVLTPVCSPEVLYCSRPNFVSISVTPRARKHSKCSAENYIFDGAVLHKKDTFSEVAHFIGPTFTITGRFTSLRSVRGTIKGTSGCGSDTYRITLAKPVLTQDPCVLLHKVQAARLIAAGSRVSLSNDGLAVAQATCVEDLGSRHELIFDVAGSRKADDAQFGGTPAGPAHPLKGLGRGGAYYYSLSEFPYTDFYVLFQRGNAWASLRLQITKAGTCTAPNNCPLPAPVIAKARRAIIEVARKLDPLIGS